MLLADQAEAISPTSKPFVIWSGIVSALAALVLALSQTWPMAVVGAFVLGYGIYIANALPQVWLR